MGFIIGLKYPMGALRFLKTKLITTASGGSLGLSVEEERS